MHHADAGGGRRLTRRSFADAASRQLLCNDGSEAGFYLSEGDGSNSLVLLYQQSGGWCWDRASCDKRPEWYTGNSRWESTKAPGGIFDSALFAGATQVYLPYCSSDAWMSEMGFHANFSKWFRGRAIRDAAVDELVAAGLLGSAHRLVFAGVSAGGRGAMATIDSLGERLASLGMPPPFGVLDGVAYQDVPPLNSWTPLAEQCERVWRALQVEPPAHCTAQFPAREAWKCIMGTYALPRLASEFLAVTFLYDSYQLGNLGYMLRPRAARECYLEPRLSSAPFPPRVQVRPGDGRRFCLRRVVPNAQREDERRRLCSRQLRLRAGVLRARRGWRHLVLDQGGRRQRRRHAARRTPRRLRKRGRSPRPRRHEPDLSQVYRSGRLAAGGGRPAARRGRLVRRRAVQPPRCPGGHHVVLGLRGRVFRRG
mmetsp:Transcript_18022/g.53441  ORF Transcript_18022/g.53441 Transcript_18022/m.53441 type:complete len:425 (+) Transcript_18022:88-1362(+)